jgi:hypothetical protein
MEHYPGNLRDKQGVAFGEPQNMGLSLTDFKP